MITDLEFSEAIPSAAQPPSRVFDKWGKAAIAGFQAVPDLLFKHQDTLGLSSTDLVVLLNILMHWWYPEQKPYPRPTTIAKRMGVHARTIQRTIERLENIGVIKRTKIAADPKSPIERVVMDPTPLVQRLEELAEQDHDYIIRSKIRFNQITM